MDNEGAGAAERILAFADAELGKLPEERQRQVLEAVLKHLRTWLAVIAAGEESEHSLPK